MEGWHLRYVILINYPWIYQVHLSRTDNKVIFCTGGAGTICSAQVRALVHLGANACIVGRNVEKTEKMAQDLATARKGAKVFGIGSVDVRSIQSLQTAVDRCVNELGGIDFVMYVNSTIQCHCNEESTCPTRSMVHVIDGHVVPVQRVTFSPRSTSSVPTPSNPSSTSMFLEAIIPSKPLSPLLFPQPRNTSPTAKHLVRQAQADASSLSAQQFTTRQCRSRHMSASPRPVSMLSPPVQLLNLGRMA